MEALDRALHARDAEAARAADAEARVRAQQGDIEELLATVQRLEFQRERLPLGCIEWDDQWRVAQWNAMAEQIFGWSRAEAVGRLTLRDLLPESEWPAVEARIEQLLAGGGGQHHIARNTRRSGDSVLCEWFDTPLFDARGQASGVVSVVRDVTQRLDWERRLLDASNRDGLTGLPNRSCFVAALDEALSRPGEEFALLYIDLDRFKAVNDSMGHSVGDRLLQAVADRLVSIFRDQDMVGRLGGDEFAIMLGGMSDPSEAALVAGRVGEMLRRPFVIGNREILTSASIGVAMSARRHGSGEDILRDADVAMYRAKEAGRARHMLFDHRIHRQVVRRMQVEHELQRAAELAQLRLVYQPIVELGTRRVVGFESLLRWRHPTWGEVSPAEFVPIAEETGRIVSMGAWVVEEACRRLEHWRGTGGDDFYVTINISPRQLADDTLVRRIADALESHGLPPRQLGVEITETSIIEGHNVGPALSALRGLGVRLFMDDFGTGWSSLANLLQLDLDAFKIDRGFVSGGHERGEDFLRAILLLSRSIDRPAVAEGIENTEQLQTLLDLGARYGQGFLFGRPLEAGEVPMVLGKVLEPGAIPGPVDGPASMDGFAPGRDVG
ncbi:MAG: EAL domain-containing protein [Deltaproteobacteria bacterium]|nr:MAG: EAL domain-containing protein [Deltaproteobacteria bacterium]